MGSTPFSTMPHRRKCNAAAYTLKLPILGPLLGDLMNHPRILVLPDEQSMKKGFLEAQNSPYCLGRHEGCTVRDDTVREMVEVLAQEQKVHSTTPHQQVATYDIFPKIQKTGTWQLARFV